MTTEKDIKNFILENRIIVPKDDKFMEELSRKINLLPTPASLAIKQTDATENKRFISLISKTLKKKNRQIALEALIINCVVCGMALWLTSAIGAIESESEIVRAIGEFKYLICGILCVTFVLCYNKFVYSELFQ